MKSLQISNIRHDSNYHPAPQFLVPAKNEEKNGAQGRIRTTDTRIFSPLLYQLSYLGILGAILGHSWRH